MKKIQKSIIIVMAMLMLVSMTAVLSVSAYTDDRTVSNIVLTDQHAGTTAALATYSITYDSYDDSICAMNHLEYKSVPAIQRNFSGYLRLVVAYSNVANPYDQETGTNFTYSSYIGLGKQIPYGYVCTSATGYYSSNRYTSANGSVYYANGNYDGFEKTLVLNNP